MPPWGSRKRGHVSIVGAGPGDPGLITVRGLAALEEADVVVHDRLVHPDLLAGRVAVDVGKEPGHHPVPQEEINALLVRLAEGIVWFGTELERETVNRSPDGSV